MAVMLLERNPCEARAALLEDGLLAELSVEPVRERGRVGEIHLGRVSRVVPAIDAAFVDVGLDRDAFLFVDDLVVPEADGAAERPAIDHVLRPAQEVLVQVVKDPLPGKGARLTMQVALPGRLVVLLPFGRSAAASRRLHDEAERERLLALATELAPPEAALIVRTAAAGAERGELAAEVSELAATWQSIREQAGASRAPTRLHGDLPPALRVVRDWLDPEVEELWVEGQPLHEEVRAFLSARAPELSGRLRLEPAEGELFHRFRVDRQIEAALEARAELPSGGHLVIQPTEALVAIDVNSGSSLASPSLAGTALETNLEAAAEVARQVRLRDLAGIIVVDFIDMEDAEHRALLIERLEAALARDRARSQVAPISEFGLVAITRKRDRANLYRRLTRPCPECGGRGAVRSLTAVGGALWREALREARRQPARTLELRLHPELASALEASEPAVLEALRGRLGDRLAVASDPGLAAGSFAVAAAGVPADSAIRTTEAPA